MVHLVVLRDRPQPLTCINYFSRARNDNLAVVTPVDFRTATLHLDLDGPLGFFPDHRGYRGRTGTRSRCRSFADAAFPDAQFYVVTILYAHKNHVRAIGKLFMVLD